MEISPEVWGRLLYTLTTSRLCTWKLLTEIMILYVYVGYEQRKSAKAASTDVYYQRSVIRHLQVQTTEYVVGSKHCDGQNTCDEQPPISDQILDQMGVRI